MRNDLYLICHDILHSAAVFAAREAKSALAAARLFIRAKGAERVSPAPREPQ